MDRCKKQKAIMPIWRPISTQSVDCCGRSDVQYEVQEVCNNASSCMDDVQNVAQDERNSGIPTSLTESTNVVNSDKQSEFTEGKRSVLLSSKIEDIEDAPGRRTCETDFKSNEAIYQKEGTEETLQEVSSNNDAESGCGVEKHLISVELHATSMNVSHRKRKRTGRYDSFDAWHIFKVHGSKDWGEYHIREVHFSQRFKFDESGYYHCCALIPLPENLQTE